MSNAKRVRDAGPESQTENDAPMDAMDDEGSDVDAEVSELQKQGAPSWFVQAHKMVGERNNRSKT
eukprot:2903945-Karenia_brevis.AAC.1